MAIEEVPSQQRIFPAFIEEPISASDSISAGVVRTLARVNEDANATDVPTPIATMSRRGNLTEQASATDTYNNVFDTGLKETIAASDKSTTTVSYAGYFGDRMFPDGETHVSPLIFPGEEVLTNLQATVEYPDYLNEPVMATDSFDGSVDFAVHVYEHAYDTEGEFEPTTFDYHVGLDEPGFAISTDDSRLQAEFDVDIYEPADYVEGEFCEHVVPADAISDPWIHVLGVELKSTASTRR